MDRFIASLEAVDDSDLMLCHTEGIAYQRDMSVGRVSYDSGYLEKCEAYEGSEIAKAVNAGRCAMVARHLKAGSALLDYGAGTGAFVKAAKQAGFRASGFDVIPEAVRRLQSETLYEENLHGFSGFTAWDSIEHMEHPSDLLERLKVGAWLFVSIPIFSGLDAIRSSRHYRPGEHLYYFTDEGLLRWMLMYGYELMEVSSHETDAGRDSIGAFAFKRMREST